MRVLQINTLARTKSTGRMVYEMHNEFLKKDVDSYVAVSAEGIKEERYGQYIIGNHLDMKLHALGSRIFGLQGYFSKRYTRKLLNYISRIKPDVVIIHVIHSNFINVNNLLKYLKNNNIKTLIILHDLWFMTGHCVYPTTTNCEKYKSKCQKCDQLKEGNISYFFDTSIKIWKDREKIFNDWNNLVIVGVSKWAMQCAKESALMQKNSHITYIYNWINQEKFRYINKNQNKKFLILGVSVSWSVLKGIEDFIKLSWMLKDEKLILVGHMDRVYKEKFNHEKVILIEYTDSEEELVELYNEANVYVSLSVQETFGKTVAEAICCGTPAVVYNRTASPELVSDGCGYVVEAGDLNDVYEKIKEIRYRGKDYYNKKCLHKAKKEFSLSKNIDKYISLIERT